MPLVAINELHCDVSCFDQHLSDDSIHLSGP